METAESTASCVLCTDTAENLAYVFDLYPSGYIVVSADKRIGPIIAYSYTSTFSCAPSHTNVLLQLVQTDLTLRMQALSEGFLNHDRIEANEEAWASLLRGEIVSSGTVTWGPWVTTPTWRQGSPYSDLCPDDPVSGERCPTGCGPTAVAQILNYCRYPLSVAFANADDYTTTTHGIAIAAASASMTTIDYNHGYPADDVKAGLSYAAGVAVRADYTSDGTSSWSANLASSLGGGLPDWSTIVPMRWNYASTDYRTASEV